MAFLLFFCHTAWYDVVKGGVIMRNIANTIKLLRLEKQLTQQQLADSLKIKRSALSMYEADLRIPPDEVKEAICDFFNVDMNYLFGLTNTRNSYREKAPFSEIDEISKIKNQLLDIVDCLSDENLKELINYATYLANSKDPRKPLEETLFEIKEKQYGVFEEQERETYVRSEDEKIR